MARPVGRRCIAPRPSAFAPRRGSCPVTRRRSRRQPHAEPHQHAAGQPLERAAASAGHERSPRPRHPESGQRPSTTSPARRHRRHQQRARQHRRALRDELREQRDEEHRELRVGEARHQADAQRGARRGRRGVGLARQQPWTPSTISTTAPTSLIVVNSSAEAATTAATPTAANTAQRQHAERVARRHQQRLPPPSAHRATDDERGRDPRREGQHGGHRQERQQRAEHGSGELVVDLQRRRARLGGRGGLGRRVARRLDAERPGPARPTRTSR